MVRPQKRRRVRFDPKISYFKPRGIPMMELTEVTLAVDELEALRLADLLGLSHEDAGAKMGVSRATFGRIVQKARKTMADALVNGRAVQVEGGNYIMEEKAMYRDFKCRGCGHQWKEPFGTGRPPLCPKCKEKNLHRI